MSGTNGPQVYIYVKNNSNVPQTVIAPNGIDSVLLYPNSITRISAEFAAGLNLAVESILGTDTNENPNPPNVSGVNFTPVTDLQVGLPPYTVLCSQGVANALTAVPLAPNQVLYRDASGDLISGLDLNITISRPYDESYALTQGSMLLANLTYSPDSSGLIADINGVQLIPGQDYIISGQSLMATNALNIAYGGSTNDGQGFAGTDTIRIVYYASIT